MAPHQQQQQQQLQQQQQCASSSHPSAFQGFMDGFMSGSLCGTQNGGGHLLANVNEHNATKQLKQEMHSPRQEQQQQNGGGGGGIFHHPQMNAAAGDTINGTINGIGNCGNGIPNGRKFMFFSGLPNFANSNFAPIFVIKQ
jgi:hypothetical protein